MKKLFTLTGLLCLAIFGVTSCTTVENPAPTTTSTTSTRETTVARPTSQTQTTTTRSSGGY